MDAFICTACGTQYTPSSVASLECLICEEERQYVPPRGQTWTTLAALAVHEFDISDRPEGSFGVLVRAGWRITSVPSNGDDPRLCLYRVLLCVELPQCASIVGKFS
jgi:hypothetical protein